MIEIGKPAYIKCDEDSHYVEVRMQKPQDDLSILERINQHILEADIKKANVCLSGGCDSQFWLRVLQQLNIPMKATTYLSMWNGAPINTDDYTTAKLCVDKFNIDWNVVEIDLKELLESTTPREYVKQYGIKSQQIALHFKFFEMIKNKDETIFTGGEIPEMTLTDSGLGATLYHMTSTSFRDVTLPYLKFFKQNNIQAFKDPFSLDNILPYQLAKQYIEIVKETKTHFTVYKDMTATPDRLKNKIALYESIVPGTVNPLLKLTGFERIKKYLATETGVYNQFDKTYREPLEIYREQLYGNMNDWIIKEKNPHIIKELSEEFLQVVKDVDSKEKQTYLFDF